MIGRLRGRVDGRGDGWVLIDVGGVGYMVEGSARMLDNLPGDGEAVSLAIETYVRETNCGCSVLPAKRKKLVSSADGCARGRGKSRFGHSRRVVG